ncbi:MAG: peptidase C39 family protein, partial [Micromonosporaceae bacterium]
DTDFAHGASEGTLPTGTGGITFGTAAGTTDYTDPFGHGTRTWEYARWTGPGQAIGFDASELIASWTADTPKDTWLQVEARTKTKAGATTKWYVMGRWASGDEDIHRTSVPAQGDDNATVAVDTLVAREGVAFSDYQLRVTLYRAPGTQAAPALRSTGAMASFVPERKTVPVSPGGEAWGVELAVPKLSQHVHDGHYPEYGNGGEAWCSPTSTSMVLDYWKHSPPAEDTAWVGAGHPDPQVDHAARYTYDFAYEGAGNWPYNVAYAGRYGMEGFVTRLRTVTELERFIKAGIPVVTSQSFKKNELPGAGYGTNGHLFLVVGFTETGDVIVNDPASADNSVVRRVYPRANFENVWLRSSSSGGIAYIMRPPGVSLPAGMPGLPA